MVDEDLIHEVNIVRGWQMYENTQNLHFSMQAVEILKA